MKVLFLSGVLYGQLSMAFILQGYPSLRLGRTRIFATDEDGPPSLEDTIQKRNYIVQRENANKGDPEDVKSYESSPRLAPWMNGSLTRQLKGKSGDPEDVKLDSSPRLAPWMNAEANYEIRQTTRQDMDVPPDSDEETKYSGDPVDVKWNAQQRLAPWMSPEPVASNTSSTASSKEVLLHMKLNQVESQKTKRDQGGDPEDVIWDKKDRLAPWMKENTTNTDGKEAILHRKLQTTAVQKKDSQAGNPEDVIWDKGERLAPWMKVKQDGSTEPKIKLNTVGKPPSPSSSSRQSWDPEDVTWGSGDRQAPWMKSDPKIASKDAVLHMKIQKESSFSKEAKTSQSAGDPEDVIWDKKERLAPWMKEKSLSDIDNEPKIKLNLAGGPTASSGAPSSGDPEDVTWDKGGRLAPWMKTKPSNSTVPKENIIPLNPVGGISSAGKTLESGDPEGVKWQNKGDRLAPWMKTRPDENPPSSPKVILKSSGSIGSQKESAPRSGDPEGVKWQEKGERTALWMESRPQGNISTDSSSRSSESLNPTETSSSPRPQNQTPSSPDPFLKLNAVGGVSSISNLKVSGDPEEVKWQNNGDRLAPWMQQKTNATPETPAVKIKTRPSSPQTSAFASGDPEGVKWQNKGDRLAPWMQNKEPNRSPPEPILGGKTYMERDDSTSPGDPGEVKRDKQRQAPWMRLDSQPLSKSHMKKEKPMVTTKDETAPVGGNPTDVLYWERREKRVARWITSDLSGNEGPEGKILSSRTKSEDNLTNSNAGPSVGNYWGQHGQSLPNWMNSTDRLRGVEDGDD